MRHSHIKIINFQPVIILLSPIRDVLPTGRLNAALYDNTDTESSLQFRTDEVEGKFIAQKRSISAETACGLSSAQFR